MLTVIVSTANCIYATEVKKYRDHWGIWGGYEHVTEVEDETADGKVIEVWCRGTGDMKCKSDMAANGILVHDNGLELTTMELDFIENLHQFADSNGSNGISQGHKEEYITIGYPDGTVISHLFTLDWYIDSNGKFISSVTFN